MKKVLVICNQIIKKNYKSLLEYLLQNKAWKDFEVVYCTAIEQAQLAKMDVELVITLDMEGFQYRTLLENYQYNIMPMKQLHLIISREKWERYVDVEFAMNLAVYIPCNDVWGIGVDEEFVNRRYYPSALLESPDKLVDIILQDFMKYID